MSNQLFKNEFFQENISNSIKNEFLKYGKTINNNIDFRNTLLDYTNWRKRFIGPGYRKVFFSNELKINALYKHNKFYKKTIDKIAYKFKNAESIDPFLSKGVVDNPNEDGSNKNKDLMLNSIGMHHFHIGKKYEPNDKKGIKFIERNNELLFAIVRKDAVYFINIYKHDFPYKKEALEIVHDNWEFLIKDYEVKDLIKITEYTENATKELIKAHVSTSIKIKDKFYMLNNLTTSGHSGMWFLDQKQLINIINHIDTVIKLEQNQILNQLNKSLNLNLSNLKMGIIIKDGLLYFVENQTQKTILFQRNKEYIITNGYCVTGVHSLDFNS